ncbi:uncharacterized protein [Mytilus edulis]|uniref:uncharacterized protein n=1 Tax=Mytilus edulis TaxID=6550 RepID=UPI0039F0B565
MFLLWVYLFHLGFLSNSECTLKDKRLLLNDGDVVNQLEKKIQDLSARLDAITTTTSQQIQTLTTSVQLLQSSQNFGSSYVRWGRKQCSHNNTEIVYRGYAAGAWYAHSGSAANPVCLPEDPNIATLQRTNDSNYANIYGAEYEGYFKDEHNKNVPCSVCRAKQTTASIMIPGRNTCYPGWKMEYHGFLAGGRPDHAAASMYVCMDNSPEYLPGGTSNQDGYLFYTTLAKCGSLYCPPYKQDTPITCVVCSQ